MNKERLFMNCCLCNAISRPSFTIAIKVHTSCQQCGHGQCDHCNFVMKSMLAEDFPRDRDTTLDGLGYSFTIRPSTQAATKDDHRMPRTSSTTWHSSSRSSKFLQGRRLSTWLNDSTDDKHRYIYESKSNVAHHIKDMAQSLTTYEYMKSFEYILERKKSPDPTSRAHLDVDTLMIGSWTSSATGLMFDETQHNEWS